MTRNLLMRSIFVIGLGMIALPMDAYAQGRPNDRGNDQMSRIVDDLNAAIQAAERRRNPDRDTIDDLKRIVRRYDSPWRNVVLEDDFRDGDLRRDPPWDVLAGDFSVDRQIGMRTRQQPRRQQGAQQQQPQGGIGDRLLGAVLNEALRPPPGQPGAAAPTDRAEAYVRAPITDSFSVTLSVSSRSRDGGRVEFVVYSGRDRADGYRLVYTPDAAPNFELVRVSGGRGSTIGDSGRGRMDIEDGREHRIVWTRDRDGNFQVELDGKNALDARDRAGNSGFDGFGIVNLGGDYGLRSVTIAGTDTNRR